MGVGSALSLTRLVWKCNFRSQKMPVSSFSSPHLWSPLADVPKPELWSRPCQRDSGLRSDSGQGPSPLPEDMQRPGTPAAPGPWRVRLPPSLCAFLSWGWVATWARASALPAGSPGICDRHCLCVRAGAAPRRSGLCEVCVCSPTPSVALCSRRARLHTACLIQAQARPSPRPALPRGNGCERRGMRSWREAFW